jgi:hypothetical protein
MLPPRYAYDGSVHPRSLQEMVYAWARTPVLPHSLRKSPTLPPIMLSGAAHRRLSHQWELSFILCCRSPQGRHPGDSTFPACLLCNMGPIALACPRSRMEPVRYTQPVLPLSRTRRPGAWVGTDSCASAGRWLSSRTPRCPRRCPGPRRCWGLARRPYSAAPMCVHIIYGGCTCDGNSHQSSRYHYYQWLGSFIVSPFPIFHGLTGRSIHDVVSPVKGAVFTMPWPAAGERAATPAAALVHRHRVAPRDPHGRERQLRCVKMLYTNVPVLQDADTFHGFGAPLVKIKVENNTCFLSFITRCGCTCF